VPESFYAFSPFKFDDHQVILVFSNCCTLQEENVEAKRFAHIWNEILKTFREEDLLSNRFVRDSLKCLVACTGNRSPFSD